MRRLVRYAYGIGFGIAVLSPLPVFGQAIPPGEEGALADILPPKPDSRICYARSYTAEHLKAHPEQTVTEVAFHITYHRHEPDEFYRQGQRNYYFAMPVKRRGSSETITAIGECGTNNGRIFCGVECDGGGVVVSLRAPDKLLLDLGAHGYIRMSAGCDESDAVDLEAGADDREFLLSRVADAECPAYEDW